MALESRGIMFAHTCGTIYRLGRAIKKHLTIAIESQPSWPRPRLLRRRRRRGSGTPDRRSKSRPTTPLRIGDGLAMPFIAKDKEDFCRAQKPALGWKCR